MSLILFIFFWALTTLFAILSTEYSDFIGFTVLCGTGSIINWIDYKTED